MTHKCFKCDRQFPTSGKMVKHMRESHSSFVEDAQMKIYRSQGSSLEAKKATQNTAAKCPFCMTDCRTRKKLMKHLETEHKDDEAETGPELKIIRLEKEYKDKILDQIQKEQSNNHTLQPQKSNIVKNLINAIGSKEGKSELVLPGTKDTIEVSTTSIKLSERRYRCFWCDTSFRKRGKLMDHIDMFHKVSKEQTEVEAEMIHVSVVENDAKKTPPVTIKEKKSVPQSTVPKKPTSKFTSKKKQKQQQAKRQASIFKKSIDLECPVTPNNNVCKFTLVTSITEISRMTRKAKSTGKTLNSCIFFNRKSDNPLSPPSPINPPKVETLEEDDGRSEVYLTNVPQSSAGHMNAYHPDRTMQHQTIPMPIQHSFLTQPQPVHSMINSAFHAYQQQMVFQRTGNPFYLNPPQQYQQTTHGYSYAIPRMVLELEYPLDLTLPKYQWNQR